MQVEVVDGNHGELTVSLDGKVIARKGQSMPDTAQVLAAVRHAEPAGTR